jgi:hypothetical protein
MAVASLPRTFTGAVLTLVGIEMDFLAPAQQPILL